MLSLPDLGCVHDRFLSLDQIARDRFDGTLAGKLIYRPCFDADGLATVVAATVAGAASLCVDDDPGRLRDGLRSGLCDFVVGHLDEALRILKNEVRRGLAVSVGLTVDQESCEAAMIERGVQPDLLALPGDDSRDQARILAERGALPLSDHERPGAGTSLLVWSVPADPARLMPQIARIAGGSLEEERPDTAARRTWLERSPRTLGRSFSLRQCTRMTEAEIAAFLAEACSAVPSIVVTRDGEAVQIAGAR